jgi:hypothetical protein
LFQSEALMALTRLRNAVSSRNAFEVAALLREFPSIDVTSSPDETGITPVIAACVVDDSDILALLLATAYTPKTRDDMGGTAFFYACCHGSVRCVRLLLSFPKVDLLKQGWMGGTSLHHAVRLGHIHVIREWVASGRDIPASVIDGTLGRNCSMAPRLPIRSHISSALLLLDEYKKNPAGARFRVRLDMGRCDEVAAEFLASVVFLSDGLLRIARKAKGLPISKKARAFFRIARQLPLELQMILCYRAAGSGRSLIPGEAREDGFRWLGGFAGASQGLRPSPPL